MALTSGARLFVWGRGAFGRLGGAAAAAGGGGEAAVRGCWGGVCVGRWGVCGGGCVGGWGGGVVGVCGVVGCRPVGPAGCTARTTYLPACLLAVVVVGHIPLLPLPPPWACCTTVPGYTFSS